MTRKTNRRIYVRVPLIAKAILSNGNGPVIKARTIDISQGGVAITDFSGKISEAEYLIEIVTEEKQHIEFQAGLVRVEKTIAGFQILQIGEKCREIIQGLVFEYQKTPDFIKQMDEFDLLEAVDEEGNAIQITFEKIPDQ
jgi:c-di-GMP-binding flagellar brake protein YcgR